MSWHSPQAGRWTTEHFRHFVHGRYALAEAYRLAGVDRNSAFLAPAYHCVTMLDPALALEGEVHLYPLRADLAPDPVALDKALGTVRKPVKALLATHYFGIAQDFTTLRQWCAERDIVLIEDCSHVLFTEQFQASGTGSHGRFVVSSPYKFFACDDGGLLYSADARLLDGLATESAPLSDELRGLKRVLEGSRSATLTTSDIASIDRQLASLSAKPVVPGNDAITERSVPSSCYSAALATRAALRSSRFVVAHSPLNDNILRRRANYDRWVESLASVPNCHALFPVLPRDCAPYMFPLHIDHPDPHFYWLKHLGVPIWRWDEMADSGCPIAREYRLHLLHLPCHQALTEDQMTWMTTAVARTLQHFAGAVP